MPSGDPLSTEPATRWSPDLALVPYAEGKVFCATCGEPMLTRHSLVSEDGHLCEACEVLERSDLAMVAEVRVQSRAAWGLGLLVLSWGILPWLGLVWTAPTWAFAITTPLAGVLWLMALGRALSCLRQARRADHGGMTSTDRWILDVAGWSTVGMALGGVAAAMVGVLLLIL